MTALANLSAAYNLSQRLNEITAALAVLAAGGTVVGLIVSDSSGNQTTIQVAVPSAAVQTLLTNRQAAIQNLLTNTYGVT